MLVWHDALADLSDAEFRTALARFTRESTEFPTVAAVRRFAGAVGLSDAERAKLAWGEVRKAIRCEGGYQSVNFEDRIINAAIREMGGWALLCETATDELVWREKSFIQLYESIAKTGVGDGSSLPGICEAVNGTAEPHRIESRLPEHATSHRIAGDERRAVVAGIESSEYSPQFKAAAIHALEKHGEVLRRLADGPPASPPAPLPTKAERDAWVADQQQRLADWEEREELFKAACRGVT